MKKSIILKHLQDLSIFFLGRVFFWIIIWGLVGKASKSLAITERTRASMLQLLTSTILLLAVHVIANTDYAKIINQNVKVY